MTLKISKQTADKISMLYMLAFLFFSATTSRSETQLCTASELRVPPTQSQMELDAFLRQENPDSPFQVACKKKIHQVNEPQATNILNDNLPKRDTQGRTAKDFFKQILGRLRVYSEQNKNDAENIFFCTGEGQNLPQCQGTLNSTLSDVGELAKDARYNLALAQEPSDLATGVGRGSFVPNKRLSSSTTYKHTRWEPLDKDELREVRKDLQAYEKTFKSDIKSGKLNCTGKTKHRCFHDELIDIRDRHLKEYQSIMAKKPFLQFIKSKNPSLTEIHEASKLTKEHVQKESELLDKYEEMINRLDEQLKAPLVPAIDPELSQLFMYTGVVEGFLNLNPEYCGIAMALKKKSDNNQFVSDIQTLTPILAVSIFGSPMAALTVVAGSSAYSIHQARQEFDLVKTQTLSEIDREKGAATPSEIMTYRKNLEEEIASLALIFPAGRGAKKILNRVGSAP